MNFFLSMDEELNNKDFPEFSDTEEVKNPIKVQSNQVHSNNYFANAAKQILVKTSDVNNGIKFDKNFKDKYNIYTQKENSLTERLKSEKKRQFEIKINDFSFNNSYKNNLENKEIQIPTLSLKYGDISSIKIQKNKIDNCSSSIHPQNNHAYNMNKKTNTKIFPFTNTSAKLLYSNDNGKFNFMHTCDHSEPKIERSNSSSKDLACNINSNNKSFFTKPFTIIQPLSNNIRRKSHENNNSRKKPKKFDISQTEKLTKMKFLKRFDTACKKENNSEFYNYDEVANILRDLQLIPIGLDSKFQDLFYEMWRLLEGDKRNGIAKSTIKAFILCVLKLDHSESRALINKDTNQNSNIAYFNEQNKFIILNSKKIRNQFEMFYDYSLSQLNQKKSVHTNYKIEVCNPKKSSREADICQEKLTKMRSSVNLPDYFHHVKGKNNEKLICNERQKSSKKLKKEEQINFNSLINPNLKTKKNLNFNLSKMRKSVESKSYKLKSKNTLTHDKTHCQKYRISKISKISEKSKKLMDFKGIDFSIQNFTFYKDVTSKQSLKTIGKETQISTRKYNAKPYQKKEQRRNSSNNLESLLFKNKKASQITTKSMNKNTLDTNNENSSTINDLTEVIDNTDKVIEDLNNKDKVSLIEKIDIEPNTNDNTKADQISEPNAISNQISNSIKEDIFEENEGSDLEDKIPLFHIRITIPPEEKVVEITFYDGESIKDVVKKFSRKYNIEGSFIDTVEKMLEEKLDSQIKYFESENNDIC